VVTEIAVEPKVAALRDQLPAVQATAYFNVGSNGPLPLAAHRALVAAAESELEVGRIVPGLYERNRDRNREIAALIAEIFNADAEEIALTHSTSEGLGSVLMGLSWRRGDEVVTCPLEHPGLLGPLALLAHRFGVVLRQAGIGMGDGDVVGAVATALTPRTRVIALSHVQWSTGAVLPLRELADLARGRGVMLVVDGAQSAGQIAVDLHALGVDAYAMPGQKWLCGPEATGALFVRRDRFADIAPTLLRYAQFDPTGFLLPAPSAQRYEIGEFYGPALLAQAAALRWLRDEVGLDWAFARTAELGRRVHDGLSGIEGVTVVTPRERMAGLVNFQVAGLRPQEVAAGLFARGITIRYVDVRPCPVTARVAAAWWNTEEEIERLVAAVGEIAADSESGG